MTRLEVILLTFLVMALVVITIQVLYLYEVKRYWRERWYEEYQAGLELFQSLCVRERQIGRLKERAEALADIAATSHLGAQLCRSMLDELRDLDSEKLDEQGRG